MNNHLPEFSECRTPTITQGAALCNSILNACKEGLSPFADMSRDEELIIGALVASGRVRFNEASWLWVTV